MRLVISKVSQNYNVASHKYDLFSHHFDLVSRRFFLSGRNGHSHIIARDLLMIHTVVSTVAIRARL